MQEATKGGYENWRVWCNMVVAALDVGAFRDAILAVTRVLELGQPFDDARVLTVLGDAVAHGLPDRAGESCAAYAPLMDKLVKQLKLTGKLSPAAWLAVAGYHAATGHPDPAAWCQRTAFQEAKAVPQWERSDVAGAAVVEALTALVRGYLAAGDTKALRPARLLVKPTLAAVDKAVAQGTAASRAAEWAATLTALLAEIEAFLAAAAPAAE